MCGRDAFRISVSSFLGGFSDELDHEEFKCFGNCDRSDLSHLPYFFVRLHNALDTSYREFRLDVNSIPWLWLVLDWFFFMRDCGDPLIEYEVLFGGVRMSVGGRR